MSFLPGWFPDISNTFEVIFENSSTSSGITISVSGLVQAGDLIVMLDVACDNDGSPPTTVTPTGFTLITSGGISGIESFSMRCSYKISDGTETTITGMNGTQDDGKVIAIFRGTTPITGISVQDEGHESTGSDPVSQTLTSGSGSVPLIAFGVYSSSFSGTISTRTFSPSQDGELNSGSNCYLKYKIYNPADTPSDHTIDMGDAFFNALASFYLEIAH